MIVIFIKKKIWLNSEKEIIIKIKNVFKKVYRVGIKFVVKMFFNKYGDIFLRCRCIDIVIIR